jgi:hypothetical protein
MSRDSNTVDIPYEAKGTVGRDTITWHAVRATGTSFRLSLWPRTEYLPYSSLSTYSPCQVIVSSSCLRNRHRFPRAVSTCGRKNRSSPIDRIRVSRHILCWLGFPRRYPWTHNFLYIIYRVITSEIYLLTRRAPNSHHSLSWSLLKWVYEQSRLIQINLTRNYSIYYVQLACCPCNRD